MLSSLSEIMHCLLLLSLLWLVSASRDVTNLCLHVGLRVQHLLYHQVVLELQPLPEYQALLCHLGIQLVLGYLRHLPLHPHHPDQLNHALLVLQDHRDVLRTYVDIIIIIAPGKHFKLRCIG